MAGASQLILVLDPGKRKTGIALGNFVTQTARPLATVSGSLAAQAHGIAALLDQWQPGVLLVGMPDASAAKASNAFARKLAAELGRATSARIEYADEAYTTAAARSEHRGHDIDAGAACVLAADWLNQQCCRRGDA